MNIDFKTAISPSPSPSVQNALGKLVSESPDAPVSSWAIVRELLSLHPEYGRKMGGKLVSEPGPENPKAQSLEAWLHSLEQLFNPQKTDQLHGKIVILGLAELDAQLKAYLESFDFLKLLQNELKEPFRSLIQSSISLAGYISDRVGENEEDLLDIKGEVANLANVLAYKAVKPPLALGLFGDWGSGKTFFMTQLQAYIDNLTAYHKNKEKESETISAWCSRIVQIKFNAWNFSDANLWASIITHIYDALFAELKDKQASDQEILDKIKQGVEEAKGQVLEADALLQDAKDQVTEASIKLQEASVESEEKSNTFHGLIEDLKSLFKSEKKELTDISKALGFPEAQKSYTALKEANQELKTLSGRASAFFLSLFEVHWTLLVLAALIILLPLGVSFVLENYIESLSGVGHTVATISSYVLGIFSWISIKLKQGANRIQYMQDALEEATKLRLARLKKNAEVKEAQKEYIEAQTKEKAAKEQLSKYQQNLRQLEHQLRELQPSRKLFRLLEEHERAGTYTKHLGLINLIRADLQEMSSILEDLSDSRKPNTPLPKEEIPKESPDAHEKDGPQDPPIQRIILYIDDLDRCKPERVVEVLEAVHLLLSFPLFIVVVGVDPRWLRHALVSQFSNTLKENGFYVNEHPHEEDKSYSSPQDYLEKIFQIPFALRPIQKKGYEKMISDLLKPLTQKEETETAQVDRTTGGSNQPSGAPTQTGNVSSTIQTTTNENPEIEKYSPIDSEQLEFSDWETRDIHLLWPLFRTPRTIKRFVNIYRLIRAGLQSDEKAHFIGNEARPGEYQFALFLLVIFTTMPNDALRLLHLINGVFSKEKDGGPALSVESLLMKMKKALPETDKELERLLDKLSTLHAAGFAPEFSKGTFEKWGFKIARYSFSIQPDLVLAGVGG